jgi:hypothetical protein
MVSSTLNPQAITRNSKATFDSFGSFMTGGNLGASSVVTNAANKIVGFNRPGVAPITPNINNLISNISTNILNQVDNSIKNTTNFLKNETDLELNKLRSDLYSRLGELQSNINYLQKDTKNVTTEIQSKITNPLEFQVQNQTSVSDLSRVIENIQNQVKSVLDNTLRNFSKDYQDKVKSFDDTRPNTVLSKFLDLYRNAIGFVNFFGDRKNISTVDKNLKALRKIFEESFEVAAVLRQTIIKIVNQLSNLPTASPSSGGLNLDIDVPGGRLRQAGGPKVRNIARAGGIVGAGLLAAGGAVAATSGMGRAKEYQESLLSSGVSPAPGEQYIPKGIVESFSAIVDRFVAAVNGLLSGAKSSAGAGGGGGGGGVSPTTPPGKEATATMGSFSQGVTEKGAEITQRLQKDLGLKDYQASAIVGNLLNESSQLNPAQLQGGGSGLLTEAMRTGSGYGWAQWTSPGRQKRLFEYAKSKGIDPTKQPLTDEINYGFLVKELSTNYADVLRDLKASGNIEAATKIILGRYEGPADQGPRELRERVVAAEQVLGKSKTLGTITPQKSQTTQVTAAPIASQSAQARAQTISQPAQQVPQTISLPPTIIDAGGGGQQQSSGGNNLVTPPSNNANPPEVPFLPTTNPDNFLTMYSRIVYNIVDG